MPPQRSDRTSASARASRAAQGPLQDREHDQCEVERQRLLSDLEMFRKDRDRLRDLMRKAAEEQYLHGARTATDKDLEEHIFNRVPALHARALHLLARVTGRAEKPYTSEEQFIAEIEQLLAPGITPAPPAPATQHKCKVMNETCPADPITLEERDWCEVEEPHLAGPDEKGRCFHILELAKSMEDGLSYVNVYDRMMFGEEGSGNTRRSYYQNYKSGGHDPKVPLLDYWNRPFTTEEVLQIGAHLASIDSLKKFPLLAAVIQKMSEGELENTKEDENALSAFVKKTAKELKKNPVKGVFEISGPKVYISEKERRELEHSASREHEHSMGGGRSRKRGSRKHGSRKRGSIKKWKKSVPRKKRASRKH
jgi:hypothetical protein